MSRKMIKKSEEKLCSFGTVCNAHDDHIIRSGTHRIQRPAVAQSREFREFRVGLAVIQCMVISRNITFPFLVNANGFLARIFLVRIVASIYWRFFCCRRYTRSANPNVPAFQMLEISRVCLFAFAWTNLRDKVNQSQIKTYTRKKSTQPTQNCCPNRPV